uniref:Tudor domain-containing protein n=1 Tax=Syphacia muris TaxID=451379 RepID=A0A0N5AKU1_9BILA
MSQNNEHDVIAKQINISGDIYAARIPCKFETETNDNGVSEGNALLKALLSGSPNLVNRSSLPLSSPDASQNLETTLKKSQFSFLPYDRELPCLVRAKVTGRIGRKLYMVRDVEVLTYLYEHITRPSVRLAPVFLQNPNLKIPCLARTARHFSHDKQRRSNPRLYRGVVSNFDFDTSTCTIYLVDYGEEIVCSTFSVYDLSNQTAPAIETRAAAFKFQLIGILLDERCCSVDFELKSNCNYDLRLTGKDGEIFTGFICMQSEADLSGSVVPHATKCDEGEMKLKKDQELERKKAKLYEKTKKLKAEQQLFELQAYERQHKLMLMMIQLQFAQVSQKIDMLANNALYRSSMGSYWNSTAPVFPVMLPPYTHYPFGVPMLNNFMQSVENSSVPQLQNVPFNNLSSFPSLLNRQYPFIEGLIHEPLSGDEQSDSISTNGLVNKAVEQQQIPEKTYEFPKLDCDEPPGFLMEPDKSKKQIGNFHARTDAFYYELRKCEKSSGTFDGNGKVLEFRNSGRTSRGMSSLRPRIKQLGENQTDEISLMQNEVSEAVILSKRQTDCNIGRLHNVEKQLKDTDSSSTWGSLDLEEKYTAPLSSSQLIKSLHYVEYIPYMDVNEGIEYRVKRSDDDRTNSEWPLFFVQIQNDEVLNLIAEYFDSLHSDDILPESEVVIGKLCLSYSHEFQAMFRAVITAVMETDVEVHYIDYGNYENVTRSELRSINDQPEITRTHKAVAVPCVIKGLDEAVCAEEMLEEDIAAIKEVVACDDESSFILRFLNKRPDGIRLVELVKPTL